MCTFVKFPPWAIVALVGAYLGLTGVALASAKEPRVGPELESQVKESKRQSEKFDLGLGAAAGITSGFGAHFRFEFGPRWGMSLTGMWVPDTQAMASLGIQGSRTLLAHKGIRAYGVLAAQYFGGGNPFATLVRRRRGLMNVDQLVAFGAGLGVEFKAGPLGVFLELPFSALVGLDSSTDQRFPGRVNYGLYPNLGLCIYIGALRRWSAKRQAQRPPTAL